MPWCTDQLGHVQNPPNLKLSCTKTFMVFIWGHLQANPTIIPQKPRISFFTKLHTKPYSYAVVHQQPWACAKPTELKTFVHQDFHGIHLGTFGGISNHHISKTTNFIFSQNSPPSHLAMSWCTDNLGHVQNPQNSKLSCTNTFKVFIWGHLEAFPSITSQKPRISFFSENSPPSYLAVAWCTDQLGHVQNPPNLKLSCTKTFMVFIWGHLEAFPTLISQKPRISFFHKTPHQAI